jgi:serine phosphatase RsbU (regulator of sigma subunit)
MLGVPRPQLVGEAFGLPLAGDGVTDVNVAGPGGAVRTLAMRVTEMSATPGSRLVTLFDVSGRARIYEHEHRLVESLQRSLLLEQMPAVPGISLAARYLPGEGEIRVGGDWYDAIPLSDGKLGLAIGDVAGHGVVSAALMSQLRNTLRAYALEHDNPAAVIQRLDRLLHHLEPGGMATMVYLVYDPDRLTLQFSAAGHPYPLLAGRDGPQFLRSARSLPLGTGIDHVRPDTSVPVSPGSTLVLYTDGLVERRTERSVDEGMSELALSVPADISDPDDTCQLILERMLGQAPPLDDVALLVMRTDA